MEQRIAQLEALVAELTEWKRKREAQQLSYPVDEASKTAIGAIVKTGTGSSDLTDSVTVGTDGGTFDVPAAYVGTIVVTVDGGTYEIPYIA